MVGQRENLVDGVWGCVWTLITQVNEKGGGGCPAGCVLYGSTVLLAALMNTSSDR